jgi:FAD/FMN-containing dehydrogenase
MAELVRLPASAHAELLELLGPEGLVTDAQVVASHLVDWTGRFRGTGPAVLRPRDTAEVAGVVAVCRRHGVAVVPQGGNTGLVGGSVPHEGEVVLSLRRLAAIEPVAERSRQITVGAGAVLAVVQAATRRHALDVPVDLGARDSATVGGMVATNAGGLQVLRHGSMRRHLKGIEAVLGDGSTISHLGGLDKDNTGYDLAGLLCGSEGTLGVITAVRLGLVSRPSHRVTALVAFASAAGAVDAVATWRRSLPDLEAAELFTGDGVGLVCRTGGARDPFERRHPWYVLVDVAGPHDPSDDLAAAVSSIDDVLDVAVATDEPRRAALWALREEHTPAINTLGAPHKLDVTLPLDALAAFLVDVPRTVAEAAPAATTWLFGHVGDGNVHVNVVGVAPDDERVDEAVLRHVADLGGSISAEHGIGVAKRRWLHLNRSEAELHAFRAIRSALDPDHILNPAVLV